MSEIESLQGEVPSFSPAEDFVSQATVKGEEAYRELCRQADADPEAFWMDAAKAMPPSATQRTWAGATGSCSVRVL